MLVLFMLNFQSALTKIKSLMNPVFKIFYTFLRQKEIN